MFTHERWKQIKEIFHSARDRTPAERSDYLDEVCKDDASLRDEVEALLTADADNEDFLSAPAYEFAAGMLASEESEFSVGQKVGRYEILCSLGAGGMGQIYLAYDAQLNRKIALKLISPEFATDPQRVRRFEQEARAASALNHPNVCVIHEIGITDNGRHFIAMEYIQGITLRDRLGRATLQPLEALQVAVQVGAALGSAHTVGIVHRDIKPENIMLRPDGYVKVVDFGLAKLTEVLSEPQYAGKEVRTESRAVMGTIKYMSPEQLREVSVDERTDIWSLGIVLYEMLTGVTPFEARSRNESVAMILSSQPAELLFPDHVPVQLREVVKKALEKECDLRYKTVTKLSSDLSSLKRELERDSDGALIPLPGTQTYGTTSSGSAIFTRLESQVMLTADSLVSEIRTHKAAALFGAATGVLALLFFLPVAARWINRIVNPTNAVESARTQESRMTLLTNAGTSVCAAISPDGKWVAHAEEQKGKQLLKVTNAATSASSIAVATDDVQYLGVTFSRDSNYLFYTRRENDREGVLYRLAWPGGNPTMLKKHVDSPVSVSPRGDRIAFVRYYKTPEYALVLSDIDGANERVIATRKESDTLSEYGLAWSPDGKMVVCPAGYWSNGFQMDLVGFDVENGSEQRIGQRSWFAIYGVDWQNDASSFVISARESATSPFRLWRIRLSDGTAQKITFDTNEYRTVSLAADKIVTIQKNLRWGIWVSSPGEFSKLTSIVSGGGLTYGLGWTSNGSIVYSSMTPEALNIFRVDADGSNNVQLTANNADNYMPTGSADGRFIVFASNRNGPFNIWRMNADGGDPTQLTFGDANFYPSCSPDNQWVAYDNQLKRTMSNWKVPLAGGEPVMIGERYRMPVFSPDNRFIAARYDIDGGSQGVAIFSAEGGRRLWEFSIPTQDWQRVYWLNDHELSYLKNVNGYSNIWSYDLRTGESKQLTDFNSDLIYAYAWSPDYKQLACQRGSMSSNVTVVILNEYAEGVR